LSAALDLIDRPPAFPRQREDPGPGLAVRLDKVGKRFGERAVLQDIDLAIPAGRFVAIVGRSGGGKSTLLRLLAGLETATSGDILLDGQPFAGLPQGVRMLFQDARLLPWQRVLDNVGVARGEGWRERAEQVLADVGLGDRGRDWPAVLSGGQRQRVALARALVSRPRLLLLDEPFGALDALTRMEMHGLLTRIWTRERFTTLLITHDVVEAVTLADRVLVLKEGRIALDLPVDAKWPRENDDPRVLALRRRVLDAV
jgi:sulfonate transport system ATP-binding protein